jgi:guanine deaminase
MGTKEGGALFGNVGSLEPGYSFDALVIGGIADHFHKLSPVQLLERFCYLGETKHIRARYLAGKKLGTG